MDEGALGFKPQKSHFYSKYLPYAQYLNDEIITYLNKIKINLSKAVVQKDIRVGFMYWAYQLKRYIKLYGYCFSKDDHLFFIKLFYEIGTNQAQEYWVCSKCYDVLYTLLRKKELLSPKDLIISWRPLYDYYTSVVQCSQRRAGAYFLPMGFELNFKNTVLLMRPYFPISATSEILQEFRPMMCPEDTAINKAFTALELFMPTTYCYDYDSQTAPYNLWINELLELWINYDCDLSWQSSLFSLFSRLSSDNTGEISWRKHLPLIFNRIIRHFELPVTYKNVQLSVAIFLDNSAIASFIISSIQDPEMQLYTKHLLMITYSYFHPSNNGRWSRGLQKFLQHLANNFADRVYNERYRPSSWLRSVPEDKKLTENDITFFVEAILPLAKLSTFSKSGCYEAGSIYQKLALLRPQIVLPQLLTQLESALETLIEPHRVYASIHCIVKVARPIALGGRVIIGGEKLYPEGQASVIPLLFQSLPGIDPNDFQKCMVTFQFIAIFSFLIPLENFSWAADGDNQLSEVEKSVCLQSADIQEFVLQFLEKCFSLIQSCSLDFTNHHDKDISVMNLEENLFEVGLSSAFKAILNQASPAIFDVAIERLWSFIKGRCMEIKVAGRFLGVLCRAAARTNGEKTLKLFLPPICKFILALTDNINVRDQENVDNEVLFNLLILSELVEGNGKYVNEYVPLISRVLENTLHMKCVNAQKMASSILQCLLLSLSSTVFTDSGLVSKTLPPENTIPINLWGKSVPMEELNLSCIEPDDEQQISVKLLLHKFMLPELEIVRKFSQGDTNYCRERVHQSLIIIQDSLWAGNFLPLWDEEMYPMLDMTVDIRLASLRVATNEKQVHLDSANFSSNVRLAVANTIMELVDFMLENGSDDTKSFCYALDIFQTLIFFFGIRKEDHDSKIKSVYMMKQSLCLMQKKQNLRPIIITKIKLQHERRVMSKYGGVLTATHNKIIKSLWKMSISLYSEVRRKSQLILGKVFQKFLNSYKHILPEITEMLKKDPVEHHKAFKGTLFVLHNSKGFPFFVKRDWNVLLQLWPAIVSAQYSEKTSIIKLYDTMLYFLRRHLDTFAIQSVDDEKAEGIARNFLQSLNIDGWEITRNRQNAFDALNKSNVETYQNLVNILVNIINQGSLHFRRLQMCLSMIRMIIRQDITFPSAGVQAVVNNLISDNIDLRRISMYAMPHIFNNLKRKHSTILINPSEINGKNLPMIPLHGDARPDNKWMQYDRNSINMGKDKWENGIYLHKTYQGWYCWPTTIEVYAPYSQQPRLNRDPNEFTEQEMVIYKFFINGNNVDRLIDYLSIEEDKENDKFEMQNLLLFKRLFRNFGDVFLPNFLKHLTRLATSTTESHQRCAAEMLSGMVRGTKHWPYDISMNMFDVAQETLKIVFSKIMNETLQDWGICLSNIGRDRDPNKLSKLIEMVLEKPLIKEDMGAFLVSSQLFLCQRLLEQQQWRIAGCAHQILSELQLQLSNPYKSIRDRVGLFLYRIFMRDHSTIDSDPQTLYPSQSKFIDNVLPQLSILIQGSGTRRSTLVCSFYSKDSQAEVPLSTKIQDQLRLSDNFISVARHCSIDNIIHKAESSIVPDISITKVTSEQISDVELLSHESSVSNSGCGFLPGESDERKTAFRLMNTICKYLMWISSHGNYCPDIFKFLPYLCHLEETDSEQELRNNCHSSLVGLTRFVIPSSKECAYVIGILKEIITHRENWWRARCSGLAVLQVLVFNNYFWIMTQQDNSNLTSLIWEITFDAIKDHRTEIRKAANQLLSGCYHYKIFQNSSETLNIFKEMLENTKITKIKGKLTSSLSSEMIISRHAGILGLCAFVNAHPYDVIDEMPQILIILSRCVHDPQPLSTDAKQALSNFKRTHHDNWSEHKTHFTLDQLTILNEVLVSPSYYS